MTEPQVKEEETVTDEAKKPQEEYKPVPLANNGERFPKSFRVFDEAEKESAEVLGIYAENPAIMTVRDREEVQGIAWREMPSPSVLEAYDEGLNMRSASAKRRLECHLGLPGSGKTFLAESQARQRNPRGAVFVDCGGMDLNELFWRTVLDYDKGNGLYEAIDKRLAGGSEALQPLSLEILKSALGDAVSVEDGRVAVDWNSVGFVSAEGFDEDKEDEYEKHKVAVLNKTVSAIERFAELEGLSGKNGEVSVGLTTVEGPAISAYKEGLPLILDEYNKAKYGFDALQVYLQLYSGERQEWVSEGGNGKRFKFTRKDMHPNHRVTVTGNTTVDGHTTRSLSESAYQRLQPYVIPDATAEDMAHRFCQVVAGGPVSTTYKINEKKADAQPELFGEYLLKKRKQGLSQEEQANISSLEMAQLKNWKNLNQAANQLGEFYDYWRDLLDRDSELYKAKPVEGEEGVRHILRELDDDYRKMISPGQRMMIKHIQKAMQVTAQGIVPSDDDISGGFDGSGEDDLSLLEPKDIEAEFGTRLSKVIL
ncbi:MAG: hypothetical protein ACPG80_02475, partial [Rickettsiales bacterium]